MATPTIKIQKTKNLDGIEFKTASCQNQVFPKHFHDTYAIGIIEKGVEILDYDNRQTVVPAQSVVAINPFDAHSHRGFDATPWAYSAFYLSPDLFQFFLKKNGISANGKTFMPAHAFENATIFTSIQQLFSTEKERDVAHLVEKICLHLFENATIKPTHFVDFEAQDIEDAKQYLAHNLLIHIDLEQLAVRYRTDKFTFLRKFKRFTGMTPMRFQMLFRISKAKLLLQTAMPFTDIAYECGFYDQSHFIHYFKKYERVTPMGFRLKKSDF
jgi:AraC-like DNA-binding protein